VLGVDETVDVLVALDVSDCEAVIVVERVSVLLADIVCVFEAVGEAVLEALGVHDVLARLSHTPCYRRA